MTRYFSPTCFSNAEESVEGWHNGLRRALWCHAILNPTVHPLEVICAKDSGGPKRQLNEQERKVVIEIISSSPWRLTPREVEEVVVRTGNPPWELGRVEL